jgi:hypothetical protein
MLNTIGWWLFIGIGNIQLIGNHLLIDRRKQKYQRHSKNKNFCSIVTKNGTYHQELQRYVKQ